MNILIEKIKSGNRKAFKDFFIATNKDMMRYASLFITDIQAIEDIVQDSYVFLWENRENIDLNKSSLGYIKQIIKNKCLNYNRHDKVKRKYNFDILNLKSGDLLDEETAEKIRIHMGKIPKTSRKVLELSVVHGLKYEEIAEDMGITVNTVKYHIKTAYKILRKSFKSNSEFIYFLFLLKKVKI